MVLTQANTFMQRSPCNKLFLEKSLDQIFGDENAYVLYTSELSILQYISSKTVDLQFLFQTHYLYF